MAKRPIETKKIKLASRMPYISIPQGMEVSDDDSELRVMSDARYLRQSASLIGEALQKGFDVLQMANGDIVTTGTKTVVYTYTWDEERGKLVRAKGKKKADSEKEMLEEDQEESEFESI